MQEKTYYSQGKLLLTGEYVVLDGAQAIALPCKLGQSLKIERHEKEYFLWKSFLKSGKIWQESYFYMKDFIKGNSNNAFEERLFQILNFIYKLKPEVFKKTYTFTTQLDFEKDWGLGTSSTLINNLSKWAEIDPYLLLENSFGGSGYDIAAANKKTPFLYKRENNTVSTQNIELCQNLKDHIFFIYLNEKQNSREGIANYRLKTKNQIIINKITEISLALKNISNLSDFESLMRIHEELISEVIHLKPVQNKMFKDYKAGIVKSLGAWGGDFVLVTAKTKNDLDYFRKKGYNVVFNYNELVY